MRRIFFHFIFFTMIISNTFSSEDFESALLLEHDFQMANLGQDKAINCLKIFASSDEEIKMVRVIDTLNSKKEFVLKEDRSISQILNNIDKKFNQNEWSFKLQTGLSMGFSGLMVYLKRKELWSLLNTLVSKSSHAVIKISRPISSVYGLALSAFIITYFYKSELADGSLLAHYSSHPEEFFKLPLNAQASFISTCQKNNQKKFCIDFEQKIFGLNAFLEELIIGELQNTYYENLLIDTNQY